MTNLLTAQRSSPQPQWQNFARAQRLGIHLLVQALVVLLCVLLLRQPVLSPPDDYALTDARLAQDGVERDVTLPDRSGKSPSGAPLTYTLAFNAGIVAPGHPWSVFVPRFMNAVELAVNGVVLLDSRRTSLANRPDRNTPELVPIPASLLRDGSNSLTIRLFVWGPLGGFLDRVYVGPDDELRPAHQRRTLLFVTTPTILSAWHAGLALIVGIIWLMRRHEPYYAALAAALVLGFLHAFAAVSPTPSPLAGWNAVLVASGALEASCVLLFMITFLGFRWPTWAWLVFLPGLLIVVAGFGGPALVYKANLILVAPTVGLSLIATWLAIARTAAGRLDPVALLLGCGVTAMMTCLGHDLLSLLNITSDLRTFTARLSYSLLLVMIGIGLTWRFARALNEVDGFAHRTATMLSEAEERLRAAFAQEEKPARAAALAAERSRLMRDLHDGLGGQLVSIVALSERKGRDGDPIGDAARAALRDLRLVIDAMDDIDGDLMLALGMWRERAQAQLRPHGMALDWQVRSPAGLPVHPELHPWHVLQILRLLDEAVTNAVKHSGATRLIVSLETVEQAESRHGRITIQDNGRGFDPFRTNAASNGHRGLVNMRMRAMRCDARLELTSDATGTRLQLDLPTRFPDAEVAGS